MYSKVLLVVDKKIPSLCVRPYYNHPKGCINFNKKEGCPPQAKMIGDLINLDKPTYVIYNVFDIGTHAQNLKKKHPDWSDRQLYCCLYWQPKARQQLKAQIKDFFQVIKDCVIIKCPEASGVTLTATMKQIGINLEWPPRKYAYQIVVAGAKNGL